MTAEQIEDMAVSTDGATAYVTEGSLTAGGSTLVALNLATGSSPWQLDGAGSGCENLWTGVAVSPGGDWVYYVDNYAAADSGNVGCPWSQGYGFAAYDHATGTKYKDFYQVDVHGVAACPDGRYVAAVTTSGTLYIYPVAQDGTLGTLVTEYPGSNPGYVACSNENIEVEGSGGVVYDYDYAPTTPTWTSYTMPVSLTAVNSQGSSGSNLYFYDASNNIWEFTGTGFIEDYASPGVGTPIAVNSQAIPAVLGGSSFAAAGTTTGINTYLYPPVAIDFGVGPQTGPGVPVLSDLGAGVVGALGCASCVGEPDAAELTDEATTEGSGELADDVATDEMLDDYSGLPINTATGNFTYSLPSITLPGLGPPVAFTPSYNSLARSTTSLSQGFGTLASGWNAGPGVAVEANQPASGDYTVVEESGSQFVFTPSTCATNTYQLDPSDYLGAGTPYCVNTNVQAEFYASSANNTYTYLRVRPSYEAFTFCNSSSGCAVGSNNYACNELESMTDANGESESVTYSGGAKECPLSTTPTQVVYHAASGRTLTENISSGQITSVTDGVRTWSFTYATSSSSCATSTPATCAAGDIISATLSAPAPTVSAGSVPGGPSSYTWSFSYDETSSLNAIKTVTDPRGNTQLTNTYDDTSSGDTYFGFTLSQTDALSRKTTFAYATDPATTTGNVLVTDPVGNQRLDQYANGALVGQTTGYGTASAATRTWSRDPATSHATQYVDPNGHVSTMTVDSYGRLTASTDAKGNQIVTSYVHSSVSSALALKELLAPAWTSSVVVGSTAPREVVLHAYDANGNLACTLDDTDVTLSGGVPAPDDSIASSCSDGDTDSSGTPEPFVSYATCTSTSGCTVGSNTYKAGELESTTNPNGHTTTYTYDSAGDVASSYDALGDTTTYTWCQTGSGCAATLGTVTYTYYSGELESQVNPNGNVSGCGCAAANTTSYGYDSYGLAIETEAPQGGGAAPITWHTYDANGNTVYTTSDVDGSSDTGANESLGDNDASTDYGTANANVNPNPELTSTSAYDAANELCWSSKQYVASPACASPPTGGETVTYTYTSNGQLCWQAEAAVSSATCATLPTGDQLASYAYNALGERSSMTMASGATTQYSYDPAGNMLVADTTGSGATTSFANVYAYDPMNNSVASAVGVPAINGSSGATVLASTAGVSCGTTGSDCWTVGAANTNAPMVVGHYPGSYTAEVLPSTGITSLNAISCVSTYCLAIGMNGSSSANIATSNSGGSWTATNISGATSLSSVSCVSTTTCFVAGANSGTPVVLETTDFGGHFSAVGGTPQGWLISSISCTSTTWCIAVGSNSSGAQLEYWNGTSFASVTPTGLATTSKLASVSCTFVNHCVAGGQTGSTAAPLILTTTTGTTNTSWSVLSSVNLPTAGSIDSVSCDNYWSFSNCVGSGTASGAPGIYDITYSSGNFGLNAMSDEPVPLGVTALNGISCNGANTCAAATNTAAGAGEVITTANATSTPATWTTQFNLTTNTFNADGLPTGATDNLGSSSYSYDGLGRVTAAQDDQGHVTTYAYDKTSNLTCLGYDMSSMTSGCSGTPGSSNTIVTYGYDSAERMSSLTSFAGTPSGASGCSISSDTTSFAYDANANLTTETLPLCKTAGTPGTPDTIVKGFYADGSLDTIQLNVAAGQANYSESRNGAGMLTKDYNGYNYGYDAEGRTAYSATTAPGASTPATYTYDSAGNLQTSPDGSYTQCYNSAGELTYRYQSGGSCTSGGYSLTYDSTGNRTSQQFPWGSPPQTDVKDWYNTTLYQMDGYCIFDTCYNLYYAGSGRLMKVLHGSTVSASMTWDEVTNQIISDNTWDYVYGPGGTPIEAMEVEPNSGTTQNYLITSDNNSVEATINTSGSVTCGNYTGAFGTGGPGSSCPQLGYDGAWVFQGYLPYFDNRFYDSETGDWLNPDPAVALAGQPYGFAGDGPRIGSAVQPYVFAGNDSANAADPNGEGKALTALGAAALITIRIISGSGAGPVSQELGAIAKTIEGTAAAREATEEATREALSGEEENAGCGE